MQVEVSAPGRLCLFGEHQDFLGLSVIATAIDLTVTIKASPREDTRFTVRMPDLAGSDEADFDEFDALEVLPYRHKRDYLHSATNVLKRSGLGMERGYDCEVHGTIPMNAGTSSSSAFTIAWVTLLLSTQNGHVSCSPEEIAKFGYLAEVKEFEEPGGMMDHYTSAVGRLLYIDCKEPVSVTPLAAQLEGFVLGDTRVPKNTTQTLGESRAATNAGVAFLAERLPGFDLKTTPMEEAEPFLAEMEPRIARRVRANFINRDLCQEARRMLSAPVVADPPKLGRMLYEHQTQLRDGISVSHPRLDELIDAAMEAGALGGKLNGSGCGGCMFAYAPGKQEEVKEAIERVGGRGFIVTVGEGVKVERPEGA